MNRFLRTEQYFEGTDVTMEQMYPAWSKIVALEADCETRVVDFIDEFKLNIKKEYYIQRANTYLYFYHFSLMNRKWYVKAPYEIAEIVQAMPKEMMPVDFYTDLNNQEIKGKKELFDLCF